MSAVYTIGGGSPTAKYPADNARWTSPALTVSTSAPRRADQVENCQVRIRLLSVSNRIECLQVVDPLTDFSGVVHPQRRAKSIGQLGDAQPGQFGAECGKGVGGSGQTAGSRKTSGRGSLSGFGEAVWAGKSRGSTAVYPALGRRKIAATKERARPLEVRSALHVRRMNRAVCGRLKSAAAGVPIALPAARPLHSHRAKPSGRPPLSHALHYG